MNVINFTWSIEKVTVVNSEKQKEVYSSKSFLANLEEGFLWCLARRADYETPRYS